jgi:ribA/ribD-fused uncharacterized protein
MKDNKFTFFWGGTFSQWYPSPFVIDGKKFDDAEMYMMYCKAMLFNDTESAELILTAQHPSESKAIGRRVKNFNKEVWELYCKKFVYDGNYAKFTQNPDLLKDLMATGDSELVEASLEDKIWGIDLKESDPRAQNKETWLGTNWLGEILTQLREDLKNTKTNYRSQKPNITFKDFQKLDIRVCKILSVEKVEKSDKLYKLEIDTGIDKRIVVSAIAHIYPEGRLLNKFLPFILNLEPRKIKNIESHGMVILGETSLTKNPLMILPSVDIENINPQIEEELTGATII